MKLGKAAEQLHVAARLLRRVAHRLALDDRRPEAFQLLDEGFLVAGSDIPADKRVAVALPDRQPGRLMIELGRREFELEHAIIEIERDALAVVGKRRHREMHHVPQRLAAKQPHRTLAALAIGKKLRADDFAIGNAKRIEQSMDRIHVVDDRRAISTVKPR